MIDATLTAIAKEFIEKGKAATPGPWKRDVKVVTVFDGGHQFVPSVSFERNGRKRFIEDQNVTFRSYHLSEPDADFIAFSRNNHEQLAEGFLALQAENERLRSDIAWLEEKYGKAPRPLRYVEVEISIELQGKGEG